MPKRWGFYFKNFQKNASSAINFNGIANANEALYFLKTQLF